MIHMRMTVYAFLITALVLLYTTYMYTYTCNLMPIRMIHSCVVYYIVN